MIHARDGSPEEVEPDEENEPGPRSWPEENENPKPAELLIQRANMRSTKATVP